MTKLQTVFFVVVLIVSCMERAVAQYRAQAAQAAVNNMAQETVECAAYFHIVSIALLNSNGGDAAQQYSEASKKAIERADSLNPGIVGARYHITIVDMTNKIVIANINKRIDKNLSNVSILDLSILDADYGNLCKEVMSNPSARAQYWMEHIGPSR